MTIIEIILFGLGLWIGNTIAHRFINERSWKDSIIIGGIVFIIYVLIFLLLKQVGIIGPPDYYDIKFLNKNL